MKSNYATVSVSKLDKEIQKGVMKELEAYKDEVYEKIQLDVFDQALAVCLYALELNGWRGIRLCRFIQQVDDACHLLTENVMGKQITTRDILAHMKECYGIDLNESRYLWDE